MIRKQFNVRLPKLSEGQIDWLMAETGLTQTQVILLAIDRLVREMQAEKRRAGEEDTTPPTR